MAREPIRQDLTVNEAIGYALLETDHIGGFARRGPAVQERLSEAGYRVVRLNDDQALTLRRMAAGWFGSGADGETWDAGMAILAATFQDLATPVSDDTEGAG